LSYVAERVDTRPWIIGIARRPIATGFTAPAVTAVLRIALDALAPEQALRMVQLASSSIHCTCMSSKSLRSGRAGIRNFCAIY
jgi:hypothetical protein